MSEQIIHCLYHDTHEPVWKCSYCGLVTTWDSEVEDNHWSADDMKMEFCFCRRCGIKLHGVDPGDAEMYLGAHEDDDEEVTNPFEP